MKSLRNGLKKSGIFDSSSLKIIEREGKPCIFRNGLKKNITLHLFDFFNYRELSDICSANIFLRNCFIEYEMSNWKMEMMSIKEIFHLDIRDPEKEIDETLNACIKKNRIYPVKDLQGNYVRINKEGINLISLVYYDPDMQAQLEKSNTIDTAGFNFEALEYMNIEEDLEDIKHPILNTKWISLYSPNSYVPGKIIYLEEKSPLDFSFSFHHVISDNYKFYLHHSIIDMRNAKLRIQIIINDQLVFEIPNFPSKTILEQSLVEDTKNVELKDVYICDINKHMFSAVKNDLKNSIEFNIDLKSSLKSDKSTENSSIQFTDSIKSINSFKSQNSFNENNKKGFDINKWNYKDYTVRIRFVNTHLFWKAGWYLDGGRLVRSVYKIEK